MERTSQHRCPALQVRQEMGTAGWWQDMSTSTSPLQTSRLGSKKTSEHFSFWTKLLPTFQP